MSSLHKSFHNLGRYGRASLRKSSLSLHPRRTVSNQYDPLGAGRQMFADPNMDLSILQAIVLKVVVIFFQKDQEG